MIGWLPRKIGQRVIVGVAGFLFVLAAMAPLAWIRPAYALEPDHRTVVGTAVGECQF
ncbi:MAG: hypothetical protein H6652_05395 [Ardenticatenaceae bacterium]|nr:hypothetical protein [Ardenticatenaceae bacterium]